MRFNAAVSSALGAALAGPPRPATVLGVMDAAAYFLLSDGDVIAVLTADAVRLPCAVVLGFASGQRSLRSIEPRPDEPAMIGNGCVQWERRSERVVIHAVRWWPPARVGCPGPGWTDGLDPLRVAVESVDIGIDSALLAQPLPVLELLGLGPGLTPSGDDVLAGLLLGARAFGVPVDDVAELVAEHAPARTTALSARLLRHAIDGECVREVAAVVASLPDPSARAAAIAALARIGHTSGAALGRGLLAAAQLASGADVPAAQLASGAEVLAARLAHIPAG